MKRGPNDDNNKNENEPTTKRTRTERGGPSSANGDAGTSSSGSEPTTSTVESPLTPPVLSSANTNRTNQNDNDDGVVPDVANGVDVIRRIVADQEVPSDATDNEEDEEDEEEQEDEEENQEEQDFEHVQSPEPGQTVIDDKLKKIHHYQLLKCVDKKTQIYDCLDLLHGNFVVGRRLEKSKHKRRLSLALRLGNSVDNEETRRLYELLIPEKTIFLFYSEKSIDNDSPLHYWWFEPPNYGFLHTYVVERKRLPETQSQDYFKQMCHLVEFCHRRGVAIRDLKMRKFVFADARREMIKLDDLDIYKKYLKNSLLKRL